MTTDTEIATLSEKQLCTLEDRVRRGAAAFVEVGQALAKIRDGKGYKLRGFDTFESYCEKVFGISDRHGRRLIQSAETAAEVKKITGAAPANESVAREFTVLAENPEQLKKVAEQLERRGYSVVTATAEAVKEAVQKLAPKPKVAPLPANGKAVVIPGNGGSRGLSAQSLARAGEFGGSPRLEAPDGACPHCDEMPDRYDRSDEVWVCSDCGGVVMLSVIKWPPEETQSEVKKCPMCKNEVGNGDPFCGQCGEKLK